MNKKIVLIFVFVAFGIFLLSSVSAVCCEKTIAVSGTATRAGAFCQDVIDISSCDRSSGLRTAPTSCQSTDYCSRGTCVNSESGTCMPSPKATCQSELGGYWYNKTKTEQIPRCEMGCCIIGNGGSISRKIKCEAAASDYNADYEFSPGILDLEVCLSKLDSKKKGACVVETEQGLSLIHI